MFERIPVWQEHNLELALGDPLLEVFGNATTVSDTYTSALQTKNLERACDIVPETDIHKTHVL